MNVFSLILGILLVLWFIVFTAGMYFKFQNSDKCITGFFSEELFGESAPE